MEDKELQALFEAKRTVEANRRRQEELRRMLTAEAGVHASDKAGSRRLWPVWVLSAAASIVLLLITLPPLFRGNTEVHQQVAEATIPATPAKDDTTSPAIPQESLKVLKPLKALKALKTQEHPTLQPPTQAATAEEPAPMFEPASTESLGQVENLFAETPQDTPQTPRPAPTIHRRTSTRLVSSSNTVTTQTELTPFQEFLASALCTESNSPTILKTIVL